MNLFGKSLRPGWLCLNLHPDRVDLSHVLVEGKPRPEVLLCESFRKEGDEVETLKRLRRELNLDRYHCMTLLKPRDYQLFPVDTPKVPASEARSATAGRSSEARAEPPDAGPPSCEASPRPSPSNYRTSRATSPHLNTKQTRTRGHSRSRAALLRERRPSAGSSPSYARELAADRRCRPARTHADMRMEGAGAGPRDGRVRQFDGGGAPGFEGVDLDGQGALSGGGDAGVQIGQLHGGEADLVGQGLAVDEGRVERLAQQRVGLAGRNFQEIAEHGVVADLQGHAALARELGFTDVDGRVPPSLLLVFRLRD